MTRFTDIKSAAKELGLSAFYVRKRAREGSIPTIRAGAKYLIDVAALNEQLAAEARRGVSSVDETS